MGELKTCNRCEQAKPRGEFAADPRKVSGLQGRCRDCQRAVAREKYDPKRKRSLRGGSERPARRGGPLGEAPETTKRERKRAWLRSRYGVDLDVYEQQLADQEGRCAICRCEITDNFDGDERCAVRFDHDHETEARRGLLCNRCNIGLGMFGDDPARLESAAEYLRHWTRMLERPAWAS